MSSAIPAPAQRPDASETTGPASDPLPYATQLPGAPDATDTPHPNDAVVHESQRPAHTASTHTVATILRAPIAPATWRALSALAVGLVVLWFPFIILLVFVALSAGFTVLWVGLPMLVGSLMLGSWCARAERARLAATLDVDIPAPPYARATRPGLHRRMFAVIGDSRRWKEFGYFMAGAPLATIGAALSCALIGGGLALLVVPFLTYLDTALVLRVLAVPGGILAIYLGSFVAQWMAGAQVATAKPLLGAGQNEQTARLTARVEELTASRSGAVRAADDDRRRIERDLHDGAQQRLVALAVDLGMAKRQAQTDPAGAAAALDHAQTEVRETLQEIRDVIRGVHPAVLADRGFDAALSALAARCPLPVEVSVRDADRIGAASQDVQAAAYYVAAEALTNITRHSGAHAARLDAWVEDPTSGTEVTKPQAARLHLVITDDGDGGAREVPGGGLSGLRGRVEAADGTMRVTSNTGVGTQIEVTLPCA